MSYLDTRDLYEELCDLRERNADEDDTLDADEAEYLTALEVLADEIGEDTMRDGETMIPVGDFTDYARELAEETIPDFAQRSSEWPFDSINWNAAASDLLADYNEVSWDGTDYYIRAY